MDSRHSDMQDRETDNTKQRLRTELILAMRDHHQRRRSRRRVLATAILIFSTGILAFLMFGRSSTTPTPPVSRDIGGDSPLPAIPQTSTEIKELRHSIITIVRTDPNILERYALPPTSKIETISDEILLNSLASLGRPTGLIRYDGRVRLTKDVTDKLTSEDSN